MQHTFLAGALIALGWVLGRLFPQNSATDVLMIAAAVIAGWRIAWSAWQALRFRVLGIPALVTLAALGAIAIGEYWEAAVVTFLFAFGSYLEARTLDKTRGALRELLEMAPQVARVKRGGGEEEIPAAEVQVGDVVIVRPGEKIPVDGQVVTGEATVNQAAITGESVPVEKTVGDKVFGGTINEAGYLEIETEKAGEDTTFARIIALVEAAQQEKPRTQELLERFAHYYTPGIMIISLLTFLITGNPVIALTLLVIACPGALVIATPVSIVAGIGNAARHGVLIKGGEHLEKIGRIQTIVLDKTGTLTVGRPELVGLWARSGDEDKMLRLAGAVEKLSEHPLAKPVVAAAESKGLLPEATSFRVLTGRGVVAEVEGRQVAVGTPRLMAELGITVDEEATERLQKEEARGRTAVLVAEGQEIIGAVFLADTPRPEAYRLVEQLKKSGIRNVVMLTGDNARTAEAIATELNLDEFYAEMLPEDKVNVIKQLRQSGQVVGMVGDGINDAPALATADVGIAMGAAGTDVALETADLVLMADRLDKLPYAISVSRATLGNIKQNVVFAIIVVLALLAGVLGQTIVLASGMLVHEASVLLVIINAMRLLRYRPPEKEAASA
ncbi:MAG TPA: cadmium-translocating P-type ATPase [Firmicutes bacterium]|nr:cadmium-translocating P-type ATPase [Bacillota bacterium]